MKINSCREIAFVALVALCGSNANAEPSVVFSGIPHQALFAAAFDGPNGYAVGAGGEIVASRDSGKTWGVERVPTQASLLGVSARADHVIAVGQMGVLLIKSGTGDWRKISAATTERFLSVDMNAGGLAVVVGSFGTVLRSTDFGRTWAPATPDWASMFAADMATLGDNFHPHVYAVSVTERGVVTIGCELSTILRSTDGGVTWNVAHRGGLVDGRADPSVFALHFRLDGLGFAVGQAGLIFRTRDGGESWAVVDSGTQAILLGIEFDAEGNPVVPGMREMLRSKDGGDSWRPVHGADIASAWYSSAVKPDGSAGVLVVGQAGRVLKISNED